MLTIPGSTAHQSGPNGPITRVVLHGTVSPCDPGGARNVARYFQSASAGGLAHYVVDPGEAVQCCAEDVACWHAPPNKGSIGVELCDPQSGSDRRWDDAPHRAMLKLAAELVAGICHRHGLPLQYVDSAGLIAGHRGITTHADVSKAFRQSDHTDPGVGFPLAAFVAAVAAVGTVPKPAPAPAPAAKPAPAPTTEDPDMAKRFISPDGKAQYATDGIYKRWLQHAAEIAELELAALSNPRPSQATFDALILVGPSHAKIG